MRRLDYYFKQERISLISQMFVDQLFNELSFCHPAITNIVSIDSKKGKIILEIDTDNKSDDHEILNQVDSVVKQTLRSLRFIVEKEPIWTHNSKHRYMGNKDDLIKFRKQYTSRLGSGQYAMYGLAYKLRTYFQQKFIAIARKMGAEFWHLPSIEMSEDLALPTGYLSSHPQHVVFGYHLPPHYETIKRFSQIAEEKKYQKFEVFDSLQYTGFILEPVVCHNIYRTLSGARITVPRIITAEGNCYRYEGLRFEVLLNQWEFTMREIVFFGKNPYLKDQRDHCIDLVQQLVHELDLSGLLEIATDPFFVSAAASAKAFQAMYGTKIELRLRIDNEKSTAVASFNLHGTHFTKEMEIRDKNGNLVETACVGFGIERWIAAFIARWSRDYNIWPKEIKDAI